MDQLFVACMTKILKSKMLMQQILDAKGNLHFLNKFSIQSSFHSFITKESMQMMQKLTKIIIFMLRIIFCQTLSIYFWKS